MAVPVRSAFGGHLQSLLKEVLANWNVVLTQTNLLALVAHVEQQVVTDQATVISDCTTDLGIWTEPVRSRHT